MSHENWVRLIAADECPVGRARFVAVGDLELAVFHLDDPNRFVVTQNSCPHAGGNLAAGDIDHGIVTCPWHQWTFNLDTGRCTFNDDVALRRYTCRIADGCLYAKIN